MSWKAKGADRGKSYQVYQDLERQYLNALSQLQDLQNEVARKNDTIRHLAVELAAIHTTEAGSTRSLPTAQALDASGDRSDVSTHPGPVSSVRDSVGEVVQGGAETTQTLVAERPGSMQPLQQGKPRMPGPVKAVYVRQGQTLQERMTVRRSVPHDVSDSKNRKAE